jgi:integrase
VSRVSEIAPSFRPTSKRARVMCGTCGERKSISKRARWRVPAERMKMRRPHDVPLSKQAIDVPQDIWSLSDKGVLALPSIRSAQKSLSEGAMISALRGGLGYTKTYWVKRIKLMQEWADLLDNSGAMR